MGRNPSCRPFDCVQDRRAACTPKDEKGTPLHPSVMPGLIGHPVSLVFGLSPSPLVGEGWGEGESELRPWILAFARMTEVGTFMPIPQVACPP